MTCFIDSSSFKSLPVTCNDIILQRKRQFLQKPKKSKRFKTLYNIYIYYMYIDLDKKHVF